MTEGWMQEAVETLAALLYEEQRTYSQPKWTDPEPPSGRGYLTPRRRGAWLHRARQLVDLVAPAIRNQERQRIREALKEQAAEYRREAKEARERGEQGGWELLTRAASTVEGITEIVFDSPECSNCNSLGVVVPALAKARKEGREEVREALESDETRDRLRELLYENGWTYLTPNSVENLFNLLLRAAALDSLTKEGD